MKFASIFILLGTLTSAALAQNTPSFTPMFNGTFYDVAIKDTSHVLSDVIYYIPIGGIIQVDTFNTLNGYAPVEGGGWVSTACISDEKPTEQQLQVMRDAYHNQTPKASGTSSGQATDPCVEADKWKARHAESGSAVHLDKFRQWYSKCLEKEY